MMEEELTLLKKSLISLVVSSPTTMTVNSLLKDYRSLVGGVLPLAKFGYREPIHFIRERCSDIFVVEGPPWDPILTPKVTKNLAHIDQMVQRQKVQSAVKHKGKRRSVLQPNQTVGSNCVASSRPITTSCDPPYRYDIPNKLCDKQKMNDSEPVRRETDIVAPNKISEPKRQETMKKENNLSFRRTDSKNETVCTSSHHEASSPTNATFNNNQIENSGPENQHSNALLRFYKKRLPQYKADMDSSNPDTSSGSAESERPLTSGTSKKAMLDKLESEIIAIVKESAEGVWCTELLGLYKEKHQRELKYNRFGHTSVVSLLHSMGERVALSRPAPDGGWLVQDPARRAPPAPPAVPAGPAWRAVFPDPGDALPGIDYDPDVFPPDCMHYTDSIPPAALDDLQPGVQFEVIVGEVYSPSHFWLLRVGPAHNRAMEDIMDEMNAYYRGEGAGRRLARGATRVGQYCAALYGGDWHRALLVAVLDSDTVKVLHVDYGTVDVAPAAALRPLRRAWARLPAQAVRARLAACRPAGADWRWSRAACAAFLARVRERRLYAHLRALDRARRVLEPYLIDTAAERDACLTRELVRAGHAERRADSALASEDAYLYPRFSTLESGDTPNYADISRLLADGIALEYVDSYRRHVPGPWAARAAPAPAPPAPAPPAPAPRPPPGLEVRLSEAEWAVLAHLRAADPGAAHWYMLNAGWRAMRGPPDAGRHRSPPGRDPA